MAVNPSDTHAESKRPVSLVLSSGGARGLVHIGVIESLEQHGYPIGSIAGSSIGTLVGGFHAMGKLPEFKKWLTSLSPRQLINLLDFSWSRAGVIKGNRIFKDLKSVIPDMRIEDMPIPFRAVTTDIEREEEVVFVSGSFYEAVRASVAIPAVFTPVRRESSLLVDGGVLSPLPISHVQRLPDDILAVVNLNGHCAASHTNSKPHYTGYFSMMQHAYYAMRHQLCKMAIAHHRPHMVIEFPRNICGIWDYHKAKYLIGEGFEATQQWIARFEAHGASVHSNRSGEGS